MKGDNPPRQYIPLYCSQSSQTRLDHEAEDDIFYFPPIRDGNSTPLSSSIPTRDSPPHFQAAQPTSNDSEDELFYFPPIKEGTDMPFAPPIPDRSRPRRPQATQRGSQKLPSSKEESSQLERRRQPNMRLGRANIVNTVEVWKTLYRSL